MRLNELREFVDLVKGFSSLFKSSIFFIFLTGAKLEPNVPHIDRVWLNNLVIKISSKQPSFST